MRSTYGGRDAGRISPAAAEMERFCECRVQRLCRVGLGWPESRGGSLKACVAVVALALTGLAAPAIETNRCVLENFLVLAKFPPPNMKNRCWVSTIMGN
jgi:hypothetical protein